MRALIHAALLPTAASPPKAGSMLMSRDATVLALHQSLRTLRFVIQDGWRKVDECNRTRMNLKSTANYLRQQHPDVKMLDFLDGDGEVSAVLGQHLTTVASLESIATPVGLSFSSLSNTALTQIDNEVRGLRLHYVSVFNDFKNLLRQYHNELTKCCDQHQYQTPSEPDDSSVKPNRFTCTQFEEYISLGGQLLRTLLQMNPIDAGKQLLNEYGRTGPSLMLDKCTTDQDQPSTVVWDVATLNRATERYKGLLIYAEQAVDEISKRLDITLTISSQAGRRTFTPEELQALQTYTTTLFTFGDLSDTLMCELVNEFRSRTNNKTTA